MPLRDVRGVLPELSEVQVAPTATGCRGARWCCSSRTRHAALCANAVLHVLQTHDSAARYAFVRLRARRWRRRARGCRRGGTELDRRVRFLSRRRRGVRAPPPLHGPASETRRSSSVTTRYLGGADGGALPISLNERTAGRAMASGFARRRRRSRRRRDRDARGGRARGVARGHERRRSRARRPRRPRTMADTRANGDDGPVGGGADGRGDTRRASPPRRSRRCARPRRSSSARRTSSTPTPRSRWERRRRDGPPTVPRGQGPAHGEPHGGRVRRAQPRGQGAGGGAAHVRDRERDDGARRWRPGPGADGDVRAPTPRGWGEAGSTTKPGETRDAKRRG